MAKPTTKDVVQPRGKPLPYDQPSRLPEPPISTKIPRPPDLSPAQSLDNKFLRIDPTKVA